MFSLKKGIPGYLFDPGTDFVHAQRPFGLKLHRHRCLPPDNGAYLRLVQADDPAILTLDVLLVHLLLLSAQSIQALQILLVQTILDPSQRALET